VSHIDGKRRRDWILSPEPIPATGDVPVVGVLALQGDFREHRLVLEQLSAATREVRRLADLDGLDGLVIPGGESTTIAKLMREYALDDGIVALAKAGTPIYGTCAGLITLSRETVEGGLSTLGLIDIVARRNAFGRQVHSFEADLQMPVLGDAPLRAVFIRAPWIEHCGVGVRALCSLQGHVVAAEQEQLLVTAFHPELTGDTRVHGYFLDKVRAHMAASADVVQNVTQLRRGVVR
jgi:5'-phosphate synthase pdxT subunit